MNPIPPNPFEDDDEDRPAPTGWAAAREIAWSVVALLIVAVAVMGLYLAGGLAFGVLGYLLSTAAPAILAVTLAVVLARYLSRR